MPNIFILQYCSATLSTKLLDGLIIYFGRAGVSNKLETEINGEESIA